MSYVGNLIHSLHPFLTCFLHSVHAGSTIQTHHSLTLTHLAVGLADSLLCETDLLRIVSGLVPHLYTMKQL